MRLWLSDGVEFTVFNFGPWGCVFMKQTVVLSTVPLMYKLHVADSRKYHVVLRGFIPWKGEHSVARTRIAQPYPPPLGCRIGQVVRDSLDMRLRALATGMPVPMALTENGSCHPMLGAGTSEHVGIDDDGDVVYFDEEPPDLVG